MTFEESTAFEGSAVAIPAPVVNVLEADIVSDAKVCDVDPSRVPPDAPVSTARAHLEAVRLLKRWQCGGAPPGGER